MARTSTRPDFSLEAAAACLVAGVDEAGRGPLAGPVVAAAVILDPANIPPGIDDSKRLDHARRTALAARLHLVARVGIGAASTAEIARLNILGASLLAMRRAVARLPAVPGLVLVDGNRDPLLPGLQTRLVVGGDGRSLSIAAASIIAKVTRDRIMLALDRRYPAYGWASNQGYGTAAHLAGLAASGPCPHHRTDFAPVRRLLETRAFGTLPDIAPRGCTNR